MIFQMIVVSNICYLYPEPWEENLAGGFKYLVFSPLFGEMIQFDEHIFQMGWFNHYVTRFLEDQEIEMKRYTTPKSTNSPLKAMVVGRRGPPKEPKVTWENRTPKDWQVASPLVM